MKSLLTFLAITMILWSSYAQNVAMNNSGAAAHPTAILDISSQDKGILIPRMSTAEREAILNPATGLMVYDMDSRSFWFYAPGWQEIMSNQDMGSAGGDLEGQFPNPTVIKLQGHNVDAYTPEDKQVLKWDAPAKMWKGMDDSLSLPFVASYADPNPLLSITNTFNGFTMNNMAIVGRRITGSGFGLNLPTAIWGDAYVGIGLLGTSHTHSGVYGQSEQEHGVYGTSNGGWTKAGLYGFGSGGAAGVRGEIEDGSVAVHGKTTGADAVAGVFENLSATNTYEVLRAVNQGTGMTGLFESENTTSTSPAVAVEQSGLGHGLQVTSSHTSNQTAAALNVTSASQYGIVSTVDGRFAVIGIAEANSASAVQGIALGNNSAGVEGRTGSGSTNSTGVLGFAHDASADGIGVKGVSFSNMSDRGSVTGSNQSTGVGVYGFSLHGIGVKGHTNAPSTPAVHGYNTGSGPGVYGFSTGGPSSTGLLGIAETMTGTGFGVLGMNNGIGDGVRARAGITGSGITAMDDEDGTGNAATFINLSATNTNHTVDIQNYGLGASFAVDCYNTRTQIHLHGFKTMARETLLSMKTAAE